MASIWRPIGWLLGFALHTMVPTAAERIEQYRSRLVDLNGPPADPEWEGELADEEGPELEGVKGGAVTGRTGSGKTTAAARQKITAAASRQKAAETRTKAVQPAKDEKRPRGRPPTKGPSERALKKAAADKREIQLANLAKARAARARNLAAKKAGAK